MSSKFVIACLGRFEVRYYSENGSWLAEEHARKFGSFIDAKKMADSLVGVAPAPTEVRELHDTPAVIQVLGTEQQDENPFVKAMRAKGKAR